MSLPVETLRGSSTRLVRNQFERERIRQTFAILIPILSVSSHCSSEEMHCGGDVSVCVPKEFVCDYERDCPNGADETDCGQSMFCIRQIMSFLFVFLDV